MSSNFASLPSSFSFATTPHEQLSPQRSSTSTASRTPNETPRMLLGQQTNPTREENEKNRAHEKSLLHLQHVHEMTIMDKMNQILRLRHEHNLARIENEGGVQRYLFDRRSRSVKPPSNVGSRKRR